MADVDWRTLEFLACLFLMVEASTNTGVLERFAISLYGAFGADLLPVALMLLVGVGIAFSLLANTAIVVAMLVLVKGYLVIAQAVPETALGPSFQGWPQATLPVFVAMMFGATLGGNATLIGSASNVVSAGICAANGERVTFAPLPALRHPGRARAARGFGALPRWSLLRHKAVNAAQKRIYDHATNPARRWKNQKAARLPIA